MDVLKESAYKGPPRNDEHVHFFSGAVEKTSVQVLIETRMHCSDSVVSTRQKQKHNPVLMALVSSMA